MKEAEGIQSKQILSFRIYVILNAVKDAEEFLAAEPLQHGLTALGFLVLVYKAR
jgi:hypothetical protein